MPIQVGLQAYTVREAMRFDPLGTLDQVAQAGYRFVELPIHDVAGDAKRHYGKSMEEWRAQAQNSGIRIIGAYVTGLGLGNVEEACDFYGGGFAARGRGWWSPSPITRTGKPWTTPAGSSMSWGRSARVGD